MNGEICLPQQGKNITEKTISKIENEKYNKKGQK